MTTKRDTTQYGDGKVFKPGERWCSPRGSYYYVQSSTVDGIATLRRLEGPYSQASPSAGPLRYVQWDGVINWVRISAAFAPHPTPTMSTDPTTPQGLPLDRPRYLQETPDGWQGADHPDGPWRPIPGPQTQPPFPVGTEVAGPSVAEIDAEWLASWCEETGRYDVVAFARAILARWGHPATPPAPEPPTTVRYEFEITDEHDQTMASGDAPTQEEAEREGRHYLSQYRQDGPCTLEVRRVEVLEVSSPEPAPAAAAEPLWRVMHRAFHSQDSPRRGYAAEIFAVRDRVAPEEAPPVAPTDSPAWLHWQQRQIIRALLTTEAARAEAGE